MVFARLVRFKLARLLLPHLSLSFLVVTAASLRDRGVRAVRLCLAVIVLIITIFLQLGLFAFAGFFLSNCHLDLAMLLQLHLDGLQAEVQSGENNPCLAGLLFLQFLDNSIHYYFIAVISLILSN